MFNDVFLNILPSLDLHGYTPDMIEVLIKDFLKENFYLGKKKIVIIHGKGKGIIRIRCHEILKQEKLVKKFYLDGFNTGCTIIELID